MPTPSMPSWRPRSAEAARAEEAWRGAITRLADADARLLAAEEELAAVRRSESTQLAEAARDAERRAAAEERTARLVAERDAAMATRDRLAAERTTRARAAADTKSGEARAAAALEVGAQRDRGCGRHAGGEQRATDGGGTAGRGRRQRARRTPRARASTAIASEPGSPPRAGERCSTPSTPPRPRGRRSRR